MIYAKNPCVHLVSGPLIGGSRKGKHGDGQGLEFMPYPLQSVYMRELKFKRQYGSDR